MILQIFDVEHGACALLTDDEGKRLMVDAGHNASTGWKPGTYLHGNYVSSIEMLAVTNYDEDHVSGVGDLLDNVSVNWIWRNATVSLADIKQLKSEDGMGPGIERLVQQLEWSARHAPLITKDSPIAPTFKGVEWNAFCNSYPVFDDENNLSMALYLKCRGIGVMFTGDIEQAGFSRLLRDSPSFAQALRDTHVYVASHHGRESGCSDEVAQLLTNCYYVVISDKGYQYDSQQTIPFYRDIAKGGPFLDQGTRHVLTTRNDGRIKFEFLPGSWGPRW